MKVWLEMSIFLNKENILYSNFIRIVFIEVTYLSFFIIFQNKTVAFSSFTIE